MRRTLILSSMLLAACSHGSDTPLAIAVASDAPQGLKDTAADAADLFSTLTHATVPVVGADGSAKKLVRVQVGDSGCAAAGKGKEAYAITPKDDDIVVCSDGQLGAEFGLYALLEQNGVRFFHPEETFIPASAPASITANATVSTPVFPHRGMHLHTLHPIPMLAALHVPGTVNQQEVDHYLRWLVRNRQNFLQWAEIQVSDEDGAIEEAKYAVDHGHALGLEVGTNVLLWGGSVSSLQNDYFLFQETDPNWKDTMHTKMQFLAQADWDRIDLSLGEFQQSSNGSLVDWVNQVQTDAEELMPQAQVVWSSHVGNVGNDPQYNVYYYFVPQFCSAKVGLFVHTVMEYDMNGPAPAYNQTDFHLQRDFLLQEVGQRPTWYYPESAYWLTTDSPIPVWMSGYLVGRGNDIDYLAKNAIPQGLQGHVTFSSADEWDYWLIDYLVAHETYDGPQPLDAFLKQTFAPLGSGGGALGQAAASEATTQFDDTVNKNLLPYLSGEDGIDKLGYANGIYNHLPRVPFTDVMAMDAGALDDFESTTVAGIDAMAQHERAALAQVQALSGQMDANGEAWRAELADGLEVTALRAEHSLALYRAIVDARRSQLDGVDRSADITTQRTAATTATSSAAAVVARREPHYRYGTAEISHTANPTEYPYGAEYMAHTQAYWTSQEDDLASALPH